MNKYGYAYILHWIHKHRCIDHKLNHGSVLTRISSSLKADKSALITSWLSSCVPRPNRLLLLSEISYCIIYLFEVGTKSLICTPLC